MSGFGSTALFRSTGGRPFISLVFMREQREEPKREPDEGTDQGVLALGVVEKNSV